MIVPNKTLREKIERFVRSMHERVAEQPQPQPPQPARASVHPVAAVPPKLQPQPPQLYSQPPSVSVSALLGSTPAAVDANHAPQSTAPESTDCMPIGAPPVAARSIAVKPVAGGIERPHKLRSEPVPAGSRTGDRARRPAGRGGDGGGLPWPPMHRLARPPPGRMPLGPHNADYGLHGPPAMPMPYGRFPPPPPAFRCPSPLRTHTRMLPLPLPHGLAPLSRCTCWHALAMPCVAISSISCSGTAWDSRHLPTWSVCTCDTHRRSICTTMLQAGGHMTGGLAVLTNTIHTTVAVAALSTRCARARIHDRSLERRLPLPISSAGHACAAAAPIRCP